MSMYNVINFTDLLLSSESHPVVEELTLVNFAPLIRKIGLNSSREKAEKDIRQQAGLINMIDTANTKYKVIRCASPPDTDALVASNKNIYDRIHIKNYLSPPSLIDLAIHSPQSSIYDPRFTIHNQLPNGQYE